MIYKTLKIFSEKGIGISREKTLGVALCPMGLLEALESLIFSLEWTLGVCGKWSGILPNSWYECSPDTPPWQLLVLCLWTGNLYSCTKNEWSGKMPSGLFLIKKKKSYLRKKEFWEIASKERAGIRKRMTYCCFSINHHASSIVFIFIVLLNAVLFLWDNVINTVITGAVISTCKWCFLSDGLYLKVSFCFKFSAPCEQTWLGQGGNG